MERRRYIPPSFPALSNVETTPQEYTSIKETESSIASYVYPLSSSSSSFPLPPQSSQRELLLLLHGQSQAEYLRREEQNIDRTTHTVSQDTIHSLQSKRPRSALGEFSLPPIVSPAVQHDGVTRSNTLNECVRQSAAPPSHCVTNKWKLPVPNVAVNEQFIMESFNNNNNDNDNDKGNNGKFDCSAGKKNIAALNKSNDNVEECIKNDVCSAEILVQSIRTDSNIAKSAIETEICDIKEEFQEKYNDVINEKSKKSEDDLEEQEQEQEEEEKEYYTSLHHNPNVCFIHVSDTQFEEVNVTEDNNNNNEEEEEEEECRKLDNVFDTNEQKNNTTSDVHHDMEKERNDEQQNEITKESELTFSEKEMHHNAIVLAERILLEEVKRSLESFNIDALIKEEGTENELSVTEALPKGNMEAKKSLTKALMPINTKTREISMHNIDAQNSWFINTKTTTSSEQLQSEWANNIAAISPELEAHKDVERGAENLNDIRVQELIKQYVLIKSSLNKVTQKRCTEGNNVNNVLTNINPEVVESTSNKWDNSNRDERTWRTKDHSNSEVIIISSHEEKNNKNNGKNEDNNAQNAIITCKCDNNTEHERILHILEKCKEEEQCAKEEQRKYAAHVELCERGAMQWRALLSSFFNKKCNNQHDWVHRHRGEVKREKYEDVH